MKTRLTLLALLAALVLQAQNLKTFTVTMQPDSLAFLSIKNSKAYKAGDAVKMKAVTDLALTGTPDGKTLTIEWYNLKPDNEKVPAPLRGTQTKIMAISFDRDQFDQCKTAADLKRMTGYISAGSLAHFAVVRNSGDFYQHCFLIQKEDGKRGLLYMTPAGNAWKVEVKSE
ncbi:MAG: hypothetical protein U0U70_08305 [Chitinophagaceae bacterium]